jgi:hypothetical protein
MINEYCSLLPVHQKIGRRWWGSAKSCTPFFGVKKKGGVIGGRRCFPLHNTIPPPQNIAQEYRTLLFPPVLHTIESNTPLPREKFPDLE